MIERRVDDIGCGQNVVKVGWKAEPGQYPRTDLLTRAITAEQAGFDYFVGCSPAS